MKHLYKIIVFCGLLIIKSTGFAQSNVTPPQIFTINAGKTIVLHGGSTNAVAYQWYINGIKIPGATKMDYTTGIAGTYTVVAFNVEGCPSSQSNGVLVIVKPATPQDTVVDLAVRITSSNTLAVQGQGYNYVISANNNSVPTGTQVKVTCIVPKQVMYVQSSGFSGSVKGQVSYNAQNRTITWQIGELTSNAPTTLTVPVTVMQPGVIQSIVNISGREFDPILANNVDQVTQQVNPLTIPNVFTPNGDGVNDTFFIPGLDTYAENEITIINRWGNDVYEKTNYKNDWTGNGLPEGTYFYILKVKTLAGTWDLYKGYLTLIRTRTNTK
jgi:gliding motility-associated-like protein